MKGAGCRMGGIDGHLVQLPQNRVLGSLLSPSRFPLKNGFFDVFWDALGFSGIRSVSGFRWGFGIQRIVCEVRWSLACSLRTRTEAAPLVQVVFQEALYLPS